MNVTADRFTPAPKCKRQGRDSIVRQNDRSAFMVSDDSAELERPIRRLQLLQRLALDVDEEEHNAEKLFRTFDLSLDDSTRSTSGAHSGTTEEGGSTTDVSSMFCGNDVVDATRSYSSRTPEERRGMDSGTPPVGNSYLSTPMRMKYFPTLSPTILKWLLRTPSDYSPSIKSASDEPTLSQPVDSPLKSSPGMDICMGERVLEDCFWTSEGAPSSKTAKNQWLSTQRTGMPPTPPPSARLPGSDRFPIAAPEKILVEADITDMSAEDYPPVAPAVTFTAASSPRRLYTLAESDMLKNARSVQFPLLSPITLRHFLYVIEELKSLHGACEEGPEEHCLKPSTSAPASLAGQDRLGPSLPSCSTLSSGNSALLYPTGQRTLKRPKSPLIAPDLQHESALNQEFAALLLAQAIEEEDQAAELRKVADRLEKVALTRRRLAGVTIAKTAGIDNWPKRECFVLV